LLRVHPVLSVYELILPDAQQRLEPATRVFVSIAFIAFRNGSTYQSNVKKYPNLTRGQPNNTLPRYGVVETGTEEVQHELESIRR